MCCKIGDMASNPCNCRARQDKLERMDLPSDRLVSLATSQRAGCAHPADKPPEVLPFFACSRTDLDIHGDPCLSM